MSALSRSSSPSCAGAVTEANFFEVFANTQPEKVSVHELISVNIYYFFSLKMLELW